MSVERYIAKVGASIDKDGTEVPEQVFAAEYDFGDDLASMIKRSSETVVFANAKAQLTTSLRRVIRIAGERDNSTTKSIQEFVDKWVPGVVTRVAKDPVTTATNAVAIMTDEQKAAFTEILRKELGK